MPRLIESFGSKLALVLALALTLVSTASAHAVSQDQTQDEQPTEDATPEAQAQDANEQSGAQENAAPKGTVDEAPAFTPVKGKRTLYFVGPGVQAARQTGPIVGAPKTILPQPFVPVGTVALPAAVETEAASDGSDLSTESAADGIAASDQDTVIDGQEPEGDEQQGAGDLTLGAPLQGASNEAETDDIMVAELEQLDPSGIPVTIEGARATDTVWQGYSRETIVKFLTQAAEPNQSLAMRQLARDIAASRFILPLPEQDQDIDQIVAARLAVFEAQGDTASYAGLIEALPKDREWPALARQVATALLVQGKLVDACAHGDARRAVDSDPYWVKLAAFCMAANGNRAGVDFELSILEEAVRLEDSFYRLIDFILLEAEQPQGSIVSDPVPLRGALSADVMSAAMARLSRVLVEDIDLTNANMLALPILLANPNLSEEAQLKVAQYGKSNGYSVGADWLQFASALTLTDEMRAQVLGEPSSDDALETEESDAAFEGEPIEGTEQAAVLPVDADIALMAAIVSDDTALRNTALSRYAEGASAEGAAQAIAPLIVSAANGWSGDDLPPRTRVLLARLSALVGDTEAYRMWSRNLRATAAGESPAVDEALVDLVPLFALKDVAFNQQLFGRWYDEKASGSETQNTATDGITPPTAKAGLLFAVLDALQKPVGDDVWQRLSNAPYAENSKAVSPHFWRLLNDAHARKDPLDTLYYAMGLMKDMKPGEISAASAAAVLKALHDIGFEETARRFAAEIMVEQGL